MGDQVAVCWKELNKCNAVFNGCKTNFVDVLFEVHGYTDTVNGLSAIVPDGVEKILSKQINDENQTPKKVVRKNSSSSQFEEDSSSLSQLPSCPTNLYSEPRKSHRRASETVFLNPAIKTLDDKDILPKNGMTHSQRNVKRKSSSNPKSIKFAKDSFSSLQDDPYTTRSAIQTPDVIAPETSRGDIHVVCTNNNEKRCFDKKFYCLYCSKKVSKIPRHLASVHPNEELVKQFLSFKKNSQERTKLITKIRNLGNYRHNAEVVKEGKGDYVVQYRPRGNVVYSHYVPCPTCYGYYSAQEMWKHRCLFKGNLQNTYLRSAGRSLLTPLADVEDENIKNVFQGMKGGSIRNIIMGDPIILEYGRTLCSFKKKNNVGKLVKKRQYKKIEIRNCMREISRLLEVYRKTCEDENCNLQKMLDPENYMMIISAVKKLARFNSETCSPVLAKKLGLHLKRCALVMTRLAVEKGDQALFNQAEMFLKLHQQDFKTKVIDRVKKEKLKNCHKKE